MQKYTIKSDKIKGERGLKSDSVEEPSMYRSWGREW